MIGTQSWWPSFAVLGVFAVSGGLALWVGGWLGRRSRKKADSESGRSIPLGETTDEVWRQMRPHLIQVGYVRRTVNGLDFLTEMGTRVDAMPVYVREGTPWR